MEYKYVICGGAQDFYKVSYADISEQENAVYLTDILQTKSKVLHFLFDHHYGRRINKYINLPLKNIWSSLFFRNSFPKEEKVCYIIFSGYETYIKYGLLDALKKRHPNCKIVCFYQDLAAVRKNSQPIKMKEWFDLVLSFDQQECEQFGWEYYPLVYSCTEIEDDSQISESDIFFVGKAKNRLSEILQAYEVFRDAGLKCDFHIVDVPQNEQKYSDEIDYCSQMPYSENLKRIKKTRCLLEIMQQGGHGYTLRYCEAIAHNRRMITNNPEVRKAEFYDDQLISVFDKPENMDMQFLQDMVKHNRDVDYHYKDKLSPIHLIEFVETKITGKDSSKEDEKGL